jgi:diguanylate cyclase (GGDEF)-like protein
MSTSRFLFRVVLPVGVVLAGVLAFSVLVFFWAVRGADQISIDSETSLLVTATRQRVEEVSNEQKSVAIWDESFNNIQKTFDLTWTHSNFGAWMFEYFGHNLTYILDEYDQPIYASSEGSIVEVRDYRRVRESLGPLVGEVRARSNARLTDAPTEGADPPAFATSARVVVVDGRPSVVAAMTIVPEDDALRGGAAPYLLVSVKYLDRSFLDALVRDYQLTDAHFETERPTAPETPAVPLLGADGTPLSYLVWTPFLPGTLILERVMVGFALAIVAILALTCAVLANLWRKSGQLVASREEAQAQAARSIELANHDALTQLVNRRVLFETAQAWLATCSEGHGVALHYVDLDDFKGVNDRFGHAAGDDFLREIGARLTAFAPEAACVARQGGDEFAILVRNVASFGEVDLLAARLTAALRVPVEIGALQVAASGSVGSACSFDAGLDASELLRRADVALFEAKKVPGGGRRVFDEAMGELARRERQLRDALATAIDEDRIALAYQPIVDRDGRPVAVEALARWTREDGSAGPPTEFIPIAQAHGLIGRLSDRVLAAATRDAAGWPDVRVCVNVAPSDLVDPLFVRRVEEALRLSGLAPDRLVLEVTEMALRERTDTAARALRHLRATGVTIAVDDFGTGFSNVARLGELPVDVIKIDRSIVVAAARGAAGPAVLASIVSLGQAFGLRVVAEGVERPAQREAVLRAGCDMLQGFLIAPPLPAARITEMLASGELLNRPIPLSVVRPAEERGAAPKG